MGLLLLGMKSKCFDPVFGGRCPGAQRTGSLGVLGGSEDEHVWSRFGAQGCAAPPARLEAGGLEKGRCEGLLDLLMTSLFDYALLLINFRNSFAIEK